MLTEKQRESISEATRIITEQTIVCATNDDGLDCPDTIAYHMIDLVQCCAPKGFTKRTVRRVLKGKWEKGVAYRVAKYFGTMTAL